MKLVGLAVLIAAMAILAAFAFATPGVRPVLRPAPRASASQGISSDRSETVPPRINFSALRAQKLFRLRRDAFRFEAAPAVSAAPRQRSSSPLMQSSGELLESAPPDTNPALVLIGVAIERLAPESEPVAIIVDAAGTLHFARAGESLGDRYELALVGVDCADVTDLRNRVVSRLRLTGSANRDCAGIPDQ